MKFGDVFEWGNRKPIVTAMFIGGDESVVLDDTDDPPDRWEVGRVVDGISTERSRGGRIEVISAVEEVRRGREYARY